MIAISFHDFLKYGCPNCGCDFAVAGHVSGYGTSFGTCEECKTEFALLADGVTKSAIGVGRVNENGESTCEHPELQKHPRKGIPWHPYVFPDLRPEYGEYWSLRGIGYDLSGFVQFKKAGERLLEMVKEVLGKEKPDSWLDWRESEPKWIQFKFQKNEFDLEKLDRLVVKNSRIITKEILLACKL